MADKSKEFGDRLGGLIKERGLNVNRLSKITGASPPTIWDYVKLGRIPEAPILDRISKALGVTMEYMLSGGVDKVSISDIATVRIADQADGDYYKAPLVDGKIAAGPGRFIHDDDIRSYVWIYLPKLRERARHRLIAVEIGRGENSMKPTLLPGDIVLIDTDDPQAASEFRDRRIYAVRTEEGSCRIKRLSLDRENILIESDNRRDRTEIAWTKDLKKLIVGRVVWAWRNLLEV